MVNNYPDPEETPSDNSDDVWTSIPTDTSDTIIKGDTEMDGLTC